MMIQPVLTVSATFWLDLITWIICGALIALVFAIPAIMKALHGNAARQHPAENIAARPTPRHAHRLGKLERVMLPQGKNSFIYAIAQDGIELCFKLQADLKFIGRSEGYEPAAVTVVLPMTASLVSYIGEMPSHQDALIYPDKLADFAIKQNHEHGTGWQLLELQITDLYVGRNIGAILTKASEAGVDISQPGLKLDDLAKEFS